MWINDQNLDVVFEDDRFGMKESRVFVIILTAGEQIELLPGSIYYLA